MLSVDHRSRSPRLGQSQSRSQGLGRHQVGKVEARRRQEDLVKLGAGQARSQEVDRLLQINSRSAHTQRGPRGFPLGIHGQVQARQFHPHIRQANHTMCKWLAHGTLKRSKGRIEDWQLLKNLDGRQALRCSWAFHG